MSDHIGPVFMFHLHHGLIARKWTSRPNKRSWTCLVWIPNRSTGKLPVARSGIVHRCPRGTHWLFTAALRYQVWTELSLDLQSVQSCFLCIEYCKQNQGVPIRLGSEVNDLVDSWPLNVFEPFRTLEISWLGNIHQNISKPVDSGRISKLETVPTWRQFQWSTTSHDICSVGSSTRAHALHKRSSFCATHCCHFTFARASDCNPQLETGNLQEGMGRGWSQEDSRATELIWELRQDFADVKQELGSQC